MCCGSGYLCNLIVRSSRKMLLTRAHHEKERWEMSEPPDPSYNLLALYEVSYYIYGVAPHLQHVLIEQYYIYGVAPHLQHVLIKNNIIHTTKV